MSIFEKFVDTLGDKFDIEDDNVIKSLQKIRDYSGYGDKDRVFRELIIDNYFVLDENRRMREELKRAKISAMLGERVSKEVGELRDLNYFLESKIANLDSFLNETETAYHDVVQEKFAREVYFDEVVKEFNDTINDIKRQSFEIEADYDEELWNLNRKIRSLTVDNVRLTYDCDALSEKLKRAVVDADIRSKSHRIQMKDTVPMEWYRDIHKMVEKLSEEKRQLHNQIRALRQECSMYEKLFDMRCESEESLTPRKSPYTMDIDEACLNTILENGQRRVKVKKMKRKRKFD